MRFQWLSVALLVAFIAGCKDDSEDTQLPTVPASVKLSETLLYPSGEQHNYKLLVKANRTWHVENTPDWCTVKQSTGERVDTLLLTVERNLTNEKRKANLLLKCDTVTTTLEIEQEIYPYQLPVIFHVLYNNESNPFQYLSAERFEELLRAVNLLYAGKANDVNMQVKFVLATHDPAGNPLKEPGVEYVKWPQGVLSDVDFYEDYAPEKRALVWDLYRYVNVMFFCFSTSYNGRSSMPYTTSANPLPGLAVNDKLWEVDHVEGRVYGICINSRKFYLDEIVEIMAHEFGHYLGLEHAFSAEGCGEDTDYCSDTPNYNRAAYMEWLQKYEAIYPDEKLRRRTACDGLEYESDNIMDYYYSKRDCFTPEQKQRVRHVLTYSPLLPGPKVKLPAKSGIRAAESTREQD